MKAVFLAVIILLPPNLFGMEVFIAPILYVDETEDGGRSKDRVQYDLLRDLRSVETGIVLRFNDLNDDRINPPQSLTDAVTVCRNWRIDYLLYGYVTKRSHTFQMEVRLFDYGKRQVLQSFFGMDDGGNYERMVKDVCLKILSYIGNTLNVALKPEKTAMTRISVPAFLGYWTPADTDWVKVMLGTFTAGSGFEFVPSDNMFVLRGLKFYVSTGAELRYRLGVGNPDGYEAYNHTLFFTAPVRLNVLLYGQHELSFGPGFAYFLEFFSMKDKYDKTRVHVYNNVGFNLCLAYRFLLNDKMTLFFRNDFDFLFNEKSLVSYSPAVGLNVKVYEKEAAKKW